MNAVSFGRKNLSEEGRSGSGRHSHEEIGAAAGDGIAEALHRLILLHVIDVDDPLRSGGFGKDDRVALEGEKGRAIHGSEPQLGAAWGAVLSESERQNKESR